MKGRDSMGYDGSLKFDTKVDESGFNQGTKKLGTIAKGGLAVLGTAIAGVVAGFGAMTKASLDSVASLEQNVGGVETLFKKSADTVIANAKRAYETAGMSANDYMSTVTSFSASLLQSLGGDTEKAAEVADMAITDMSDNANKMGTSIEMIQNAYQGFAKQNYTMLDNLKLGYGGTKTEMERLLKDAEKISGIKYDISNLNDVYQAIHVIQTELGITGTTAKEAATTIEGSMNSAKAAWDNFLNGTATVDELVDAFGTAGEVIAENLGAILPRLVATVPAAAKGVATGFINAFHESGIAEAGLQILSDFVNGIQEGAPTAISAGANVISNFISGIASNLPTLVPQAVSLVATLASGIVSNLPKIITAGISLLKGLVQGIINSLPTLIAEGPRIINDFADAIYAGLGQLVLAGLEMLGSLVKGIIQAVPTLISNAGEIFMMFLNIFSLSKMASLGKSLITKLSTGINGMKGNIVSAGKNIIKNLINGIKALAAHPVTTVKSIITKVKTAFTSINWASVGKNIISGIANGLRNGVGAIVTAAKNAAQKALNAAKNFLGIKSPSRRFRDEVGKMMAVGMGEGFEKNLPTDEMQSSIDASVKKMQKASYTVTTKAPATTSSAVARETITSSQTGDGENKPREIIIHTHVDLDGKEVGHSVTPYVDNNFATNEELKERGN